jgi:hypothetical protein
MLRMIRTVCLLSLCTAAVAAPPWVPLTNGKDLDGWEVIGDGFWNVLKDGTLVGQRDLNTGKHQAWLYSKREFGDFDLEADFWTRQGGNSGISILDSSRAHWAFGPQWDPARTPSHIGYEIQIFFGNTEHYPTGSIYNFVPAKPGAEVQNDWNHISIEHRKGMIRVRLNGRLVAEHPRDANRPARGPIGLQLHDQTSLVMFRNLRIRSYPVGVE